MEERGHAVGWLEVAVAMDRCLRAFSELTKPILSAHSAASLPMSSVFFLLAMGPGETRLHDLVRKGRYLGSNASYALKALQEAGYVARRQDQGDRRNVIVAWTDRGRDLAMAIADACRAGEIAATALDAIREFEDHCDRHCRRGS